MGKGLLMIHSPFAALARAALVLLIPTMGGCSTTRHVAHSNWTAISAGELEAARPGSGEDPECYQSSPPDLNEQEALLRSHSQIRTRILRYAYESGWDDVELGNVAVWPRGGAASVRHAGGELVLAATYERYHSVTELCGWNIEPTRETWKLEQLSAHSDLQAHLEPGATLVYVEMGPLGNGFVPRRYVIIDAEGEAHTYTADGT